MNEARYKLSLVFEHGAARPPRGHVKGASDLGARLDRARQPFRCHFVQAIIGGVVKADEHDLGVEAIRRELPKRKLMFVLLLGLLNPVVIAAWHGHQVALARGYKGGFVFCIATDYPDAWVPPWDWTTEERRAVWPWS